MFNIDIGSYKADVTKSWEDNEGIDITNESVSDFGKTWEEGEDAVRIEVIPDIFVYR